MAQNTVPIFSLTPKISSAQITSSTTGLTKSDGTGAGVGTDMILAYTAGSNGSFLRFSRVIPTASTASTTMTNTILRFYVSSITSGATASSNTFNIQEVLLSNQVADHATVPIVYQDVQFNFALPANYTLLVSAHVASASNSTWQIVTFGGDY